MSETENRVSIKERRKNNQDKTFVSALSENQSMLLLFAVIVAALAVILISILALGIPAVPVCVIVLIEAALAVCLHDVPIWQHGLVVIAQTVVGALTGNTVFVLLCIGFYLVGILTLKFIRD